MSSLPGMKRKTVEGDASACLHGHQCTCTGGISELLAGKRAFRYGPLESGANLKDSRKGGKLVLGMLQVHQQVR